MKKILLAALLLIIVIVAAVYWNREHPSVQPVVTDTVATSTIATSTVPQSPQADVAWKFEDAGVGQYGAPNTKVTIVLSGVPHVVGTYIGTCKEISAGGGIKGDSLLANEVAGAQCYFAGGGDEIGLFNENGSLVVKAGQLAEPTPETPAFRGNFKTVTSP